MEESLVLKLMGTIITIKIEHKNAKDILLRAQEKLVDYQTRFSANQSDSLLMEVNRQAGYEAVKVSDDLFELISLGKKISLASNNSLNIAIGPLIKLWHIGFNDAKVPTNKEIRKKLDLIHPENIELDRDHRTVFLKEKGMEIDLGCIAKGYFADQLKSFFLEQQVTSGYIDLGGNVLTIGNAPNQLDGAWRVGIQNPQQSRGNLVAILPIKNQSMVTSGIYERQLTIGKNTYHHIFDSTTGYPVENDLASVTIVSDQSVDGEIWTTVLFSKTPEQAINWLNQVEGIEGVLITKDQKMYVSKNLQSKIQILHN